MKVRRATIGDFSQAETLFEEFMNESLAEYGSSIEKSALTATMKALMDNCLVLENGDGRLIGVLAGQVIGDPMNGASIFQEVVWYVLKAHRKYGILLVKEIEKWCKERNIKSVILAHLGNSMPEKIAKFYERMGYKHLECQYIKRII